MGKGRYRIIGQIEDKPDFDYNMPDGRPRQIRHLIKTRHENGAVAITAFMGEPGVFSRSIGGARIVDAMAEEAAVVEAIKLADGMASKCPGAGIPASGQKTVCVWPDAPAAASEKAELLVEHYRAVLESEPGAIFGPDLGVGEPVQDALSVYPGMRDHITGLSIEGGGVGIDATGYTGRALVSALDAWEGASASETAAIQGFGAVGAWAGRTLRARHPGIALKALNNILGTAIARDDDGLPVGSFFDAWSSEKEPEKAADAVRRCAERTPGVEWIPDPQAIWGVRCDIMVLAARTAEIRRAGEVCERHNAIDAESWLAASGVKAILEGANAPITRAAEDWLFEQGVVIFPDFVVNLGGVWGCWLEWLQRDALLNGAREVAEVDREAQEVISRIGAANIQRIFAAGGSPRAAAEALKARNQAIVSALWQGRAHIADVHERARLHLRDLAL